MRNEEVDTPEYCFAYLENEERGSVSAEEDEEMRGGAKTYPTVATR